MKTVVVSMLICILLVPVSKLYADNYLSVLDAWVLEAPPGMKVMAAYLTLRNDSDTDYELTGVSSDKFERVEMHRTIIIDEQARMEKQERMTLKAGNTIRFEPGGSHLMLFKPIKSFQSGDEIDLSLMLNNGSIHNVKAQVRNYSEMHSKKHHP